MSPDTGAIAHFETEEDAKKAGHSIPLTQDEAHTLYGLNRKDRRAKLAQMRREKRGRR